MKATTLLAVSLGLANAVTLPFGLTAGPPACDTMPACSTCMSHNTQCNWCSAVDSSGSGVCQDSSSTSCDGLLLTSESCPDGQCMQGYVATDDGSSCQLSGVGGVGMSKEDCEAAYGPAVDTYRCNFDNGSCDVCPDYTPGCYAAEDDCNDNCSASSDACACDTSDNKYECSANTYGPEEQDTCAEHCGNLTPPEMLGTFTTIAVNMDYSDAVRRQTGYDNGTSLSVSQDGSTGWTQYWRGGKNVVDQYTVSGPLAGQWSRGYFEPGIEGPVTTSLISVRASPHSVSAPRLPEALWGGGVGVQHIVQVKSEGSRKALRGGRRSSITTNNDLTLEGTWRGFRIDENADLDAFAFTFSSDISKAAWVNKVTSETVHADVKLSNQDADGVSDISFVLDDGSTMAGIVQLDMGPDNTNMRVAYLALSNPGESAITDFESGLTDGQEFFLNGCLLDDPGYCYFDADEVDLS